MEDFLFYNNKAIVNCLYALIAIIIIVYIYYTIKEIMRKNEIKEYCKVHKIDYSASFTNLPPEIKKISELKRGEKNFYEAVMSGTKNDIKYYAFDYRYMIKVGRNSAIYHDETLCILFSKKAGFPDFRVYEKTPDPKFLGLISINISKEDFVIKEDYDFSEKYVLSGESEEKVRSFFDEKVRKCFLKNYKKDYVWLGNKDYLMIRNTGKKLNLKERLSFFNYCLRFFNEITNNDSNSQIC